MRLHEIHLDRLLHTLIGNRDHVIGALNLPAINVAAERPREECDFPLQDTR